MRTATEWVPNATTGNITSIDIAADPRTVWAALHSTSISDMPVSGALLRLRLLPATLTRRRKPVVYRDRTGSLVESLVANRFIELYREDDVLLTLGVIGQFWKLSGGTDARVDSPEQFDGFETPGFVKASIDFHIVRVGDGTRLSTGTYNAATDADTEKVFRRYWRVIRFGSKLIRWELLRAVRSNSEQRNVP